MESTLEQTIGPDKVTAEAIAAKMEQDWFTHVNVEPKAYLAHGEMDSWYRLRLVYRYPPHLVLIENLDLSVDGHTCLQIVGALKASFNRGCVAGRGEVLVSQFEEACKAVGLTKAMALEQQELLDQGPMY